MEMFYADETGFEEHYSRTYGYSQRSKRVYGAVPGTRRHRRVSVVGAINQNNVFLAGFAFKGYMNGDLFTGWLEHVFAPSLKNPTKSIIIIDNASHHPKERIYDIAEEYGFFCDFLTQVFA
ncbi:MAG: transposase [Defluviitaleaceae bacterium]|nr:transposase [Defluviitaleaceae bacterium]